MDKDTELLIILRSVHALGCHDHKRTGAIPRTPGMSPEEALERIKELFAKPDKKCLHLRTNAMVGDDGRYCLDCKELGLWINGCSCGEQWTQGVVHSEDSPCYWPPREKAEVYEKS